MPPRGHSLELLHVLKTDGRWVTVGFYLPAPCEDCDLGKG